MTKRFCKPRSYFPMISFVLEVIGVALILANYESICIQAHEISFQAELFASIMAAFIVPDLLFFILVAMDSKISITPLGVVYNIFATAMCSFGTLVLCSGLRFCGNKAQIFFFFAVICGALAAASHFGSIYESGMLMPMTERFAFRLD